MARYSTDGSSALSPNDPYNDMDRPNFHVINGGKSNNTPKKNKSNLSVINGGKSQESKNLLRNAEDSIISSNNPSSWQNNVQGKASVVPETKGIKLTGKNKRKSLVLILIFALLFGGGIFLSTSNTILPGAINSLFTLNSSSAYPSYVLRSAKIQQYMLKHLGVTTNRKGLARYTHMSSSLKTRLAKNNIDVDGSGSNTVLKWHQTAPDGTVTTTTITADEFYSKYRSDPSFRNDYNKAKRNRIVVYFDESGNRYFTKRGKTRNTLKDYRETGDTDTDAEEYQRIQSAEFDNNRSDVDLRGKKEEIEYETDPDTGERVPKTDADGNPITIETPDTQEIANSTSNNSIGDAETKASQFVDGIGSSAQKASTLANSACGLYKITSAIAIAVNALEKAQAMSFFLGPMESINKMMAGEGSSSAINTVMNFFTTSTSSDVIDFNNISINPNNVTESSTIGSVLSTGSPLESQGFRKNLSNAPINRTSLKNYSSNRISSSITDKLGMDANAVHGCSATQTAGAVVSIAVTLGSFGTSTLISIAGDFLLSAGVGLAASAFLSFLIPTIAKILFTNVFENTTGIPAGELFSKGASVTNFSLGRSTSGQIPATREDVIEYNNSTIKTVAALDAEVDRATLSPFDTSSPNTFLGSMAYSMLGAATSSTASTISTILRTTSKSLNTIIGSASADGEDSSYMTTFGECSKEMQAIGYDACDMYGEPIRISPLINIEPDDPAYLAVLDENLNDDGSIKEGSELAKFIFANVREETDPGVVNTNVLAMDEIGNFLTDATPIVGDAFDIYNAITNEANLKWATCEACGTGNSLYFARYVEDMRILDEMSSDEDTAFQNPVTALLEEYDAEYPIDNSPAGYLAHITGLPKSTAEDVIAVTKYYQFLENYDTSTRIAMTEENTTTQPAETIIARFDNTKLNFSSETSEFQTEPVIAKQSEQYIIYADIRNRSYVS